MEGNGRADVHGDRVEDLTDGEGIGIRRFDDEMFLAVRGEGGVGALEDGGPWRSGVGGDRLVAEIDGKATGCRLADNAGDEDGSREKRQVGEFSSVTCVPEDGGPGRALAAVSGLGVKWKSGRSSGDSGGDGETVVDELLPPFQEGFHGGIEGVAAGDGVGDVDVAVVDMETAVFQGGRSREAAMECGGCRSWSNSRAVLAAIDVQPGADAEAGSVGGSFEGGETLGVIHQGGKAGGGMFSGE